MNEFIELLKQSVQIANEENGTIWGYIMLFDDGTVTYRAGGTMDTSVGFYNSLNDFIERYSEGIIQG